MSLLVRGTGLQFSVLVMSSSVFGTRVMLASFNELPLKSHNSYFKYDNSVAIMFENTLYFEINI